MFYFTSDTHFGHENVIGYCNRPFATVEEMDETLIENWNSRVKGNDTVFIIGDMFLKSENVESILKRLKGKKRLIIGNHDTLWLKETDAAKYFLSIDNFLQAHDGKHTFTMCHYPLLTWKHARRTYMVHGHIHNDTNADFRPLIVARNHVLNAGTDINNFMPVTFEEMIENNRRFKAGMSSVQSEEIQNVSDEEVNKISEKLIAENLEAYKELAK